MGLTNVHGILFLRVVDKDLELSTGYSRYPLGTG